MRLFVHFYNFASGFPIVLVVENKSLRGLRPVGEIVPGIPTAWSSDPQRYITHRPLSPSGLAHGPGSGNAERHRFSQTGRRLGTDLALKPRPEIFGGVTTPWSPAP
ncbi:hypothetical protein QC764_0061910 [Podospora pseudoanserina]|uniref:Uncharacterized protein n=1 Tax=Podospora pseudoanserina TaxID=2609844 RepID=A0ABR0I8V3_9PEZI|nr:hypothetical protein QC764_0061910 [Podospora pseudoanserina]